MEERERTERDEGILIYHFSGCCYRVTKGEPQELGTSLKQIYSSYLCNLQAKIKFIAYRIHKFHREDFFAVP